MTLKLENKEKGTNTPVIDERILPFRVVGEQGGYGPRRSGGHSIRLDVDSYVFCLTGRRGGGKTTVMSWMAVLAAGLYHSRIIANYPIEFSIRRFRPDGKSYLEHFKNEPFDFEKLILHGEEYQHALILLDEAPDVISHMASMSFKNRLVSAWVRQLRKNYTTLVMCAQSDGWIDKSMRWQIDVRIECNDLSRIIGDNARLGRGGCILMTWYDESGQWTGKSTEQRVAESKNANFNFLGWDDVNYWAMKTRLFPRFMFGDDNTKPVFDSWNQIDILDSLRKVDLKLSSIKIRDTEGEANLNDKFPVSPGILQKALNSFELVIAESSDDYIALYQDGFFASLGLISDRDKNNLGKLLSSFNVERGRDNGNGKRIYGLNNFELDRFRAYVEERLVEST